MWKTDRAMTKAQPSSMRTQTLCLQIRGGTRSCAFVGGLLWGCAMATLVGAASAWAAPEEIQVYMDEMNAKGQFGLDVHVNDVLNGDVTPDYSGQQPNVDRIRITPEFSYGLTPNIELGAYLPLTTLSRDGSYIVDGEKLRVKYLAPRVVGQAWFWGANLEIGYEQHRLAPNPWNGELKGIAGYRNGKWTLAVNANADFSIAGPRSDPASLDIDTKLNYRLDKALAVGLESYNAMGAFRSLGHFQNNDASIFGVVDATLGRWDLNLGVGHGYEANKDGLVLKAVISVPIDG
jgi:hypothetical protein